MGDPKKVKRCDLRRFLVIEGAIARNQMCSLHPIYPTNAGYLFTAHA